MNIILTLAGLVLLTNICALILFLRGGNVAHAAILSLVCVIAAVSLAVLSAFGGI